MLALSTQQQDVLPQRSSPTETKEIKVFGSATERKGTKEFGKTETKETKIFGRIASVHDGRRKPDRWKWGRGESR